MNNTKTIPPPTSLPEIDITKDIENCIFCFFDLETTGLWGSCEIVRVSDVDFDGLRLFDQNSGSATGSAKWSGKLFCYGKLVDAVEVNVGLNRFGLWLKNFAVG